MGSTIAQHRSDHWGNEGHCGPPQGGVRVSTSGAPQKRIKRPTRNHIRFIRLKNFPDRLLEAWKIATTHLIRGSSGEIPV
jgi:hypothetical protein